jgi:hypothetical protein
LLFTNNDGKWNSILFTKLNLCQKRGINAIRLFSLQHTQQCSPWNACQLVILRTSKLHKFTKINTIKAIRSKHLGYLDGWTSKED